MTFEIYYPYIRERQRQKSFAVKKAKFRGTAKCRNAEFRGKNLQFRGHYAVKLPNFAVLSR